jgi:molecular chaperone GrpE
MAGILLYSYKQKKEVMVKKKRHDQEEDKNVSDVELTDNKENQEEIVKNNEEIASAAEGQSADKTENDTDRKVAEEKKYEEKVAELQDKYLRVSAEFDNYRKRTLKEKMDLAKYASEDLLKQLLPFMDDFERAMKHMEPGSECESIKTGIDLIYEKFSSFLKSNGVKEIESMNKPFNVDLHEAVAKVPVQEEDKKGTIIDVITKGYFLQDKVMRFAKVVVGE